MTLWKGRDERPHRARRERHPQQLVQELTLLLAGSIGLNMVQFIVIVLHLKH